MATFHSHHNSPMPPSPSWVGSRATRRQLSFVNSSNHPSIGRSILVRRKSLEIGGGGAQYVVLRPVENNVYPRSFHSLNSPSTQGSKSTRPFLTVALLKLSKVLPDYLDALIFPTAPAASKACRLLATLATERITSHPASPSSCVGHKITSSGSRNLGTAPIELVQNFFSGGLGSTSSQRSPPSFQSPPESPLSSNSAPASPSAVALEAEWERLVAAPFWLLSAAEVLTADGCHDLMLVGLYQRCTQDIFRLQHLLCGPVLEGSLVQSEIQTAAELVQKLLDFILIFAAAQADFVKVQYRLCLGSDSISLAQAANDMGLILARLERVCGLDSLGLLKRTLRQAQCWKFGLEACLAVEQCLYVPKWRYSTCRLLFCISYSEACSFHGRVSNPAGIQYLIRQKALVMVSVPSILQAVNRTDMSLTTLFYSRFLDSIVLMRQWRAHIPTEKETSETLLTLWIRRLYKKVVATLPMFLDSVVAHTSSVYGLRSKELVHMHDGSQEDIETKVSEFLKRQEKLNGPPTVVAIVLDAKGASNTLPERGLRLSTDAVCGESGDGNYLIDWPPVFIRSSVDASQSHVTRQTPLDTKQFPARKASGVRKPSFVESRTSNSVPEQGTDAQQNTKESLASWLETEWNILARLLSGVAVDTEQEKTSGAVGARERIAIAISSDDKRTLASSHVSRSAGDPDPPEHSEIKQDSFPCIRLAHPTPVTYRDSTIFNQGLDEEVEAAMAEKATSFFQLKRPSFSAILEPVIVQAGKGVEESHIVVSLENAVGNDKRRSDTSFHIVSLSRFTSLVVMVGRDEGNRWYGKRQHLTDVEISAFLNDVAEKLSISKFLQDCRPDSKIPIDQLTNESILSLKSWSQSVPKQPNVEFHIAGNTQQQQYDPWLSDARVSMYLQQVKRDLGLRSAELPVQESCFSWWWTGSPRKPSPVLKPKRLPQAGNFRRGHVDVTDGAASLLLGRSILQVLRENSRQ